jgi:hypothetical protein
MHICIPLLINGILILLLPLERLDMGIRNPSSSLFNDDDDVYLKKITTRVSQNLILHKNANQPKAEVRESTYK